MSATTFHFYDPSTGIFVGSFTGLEADVEHNTPQGAAVWVTDDHVDHTAHKLCIKTGGLLFHTCPAPTVDPCVDAERRIMQLEAGHTRALREAVLAIAGGLEPPAAAITLLSTHDAAISELRKELGIATRHRVRCGLTRL